MSSDASKPRDNTGDNTIDNKRYRAGLTKRAATCSDTSRCNLEMLRLHTVAGVTARAQRRAARRRASRNRAGAVPDLLPRPLRLIAEALGQLADYVRQADSPEAAAELAMTRVNDAAQRLAALAAPYDAFDVLELLRAKNVFADPETYSEAEHEGSAAVIELAAIVLASRGQRGGSRKTVDGQRPNASEVVPDVDVAAQDAISAGSMLTLFDSANGGDLVRISFGTVLREVSLRNTSYPHMLEDSLDELFRPVEIEDHCRRVLGCSVAEIRSVFAALDAMHKRSWQERFDAMRDLAELAMHHINAGIAPDQMTDEIRAQGRALLSRAWSNPADSSVFSSAQLAAVTALDESTVTRVLDLFALNMAAGPPDEAAIRFFQGKSPLRTLPILRDPQTGDNVVVHGLLLTPAIRERVEELLKPDALAWTAYSKRRGEYLEDAALQLLSSVLPGSQVHHGFEYFVPSPSATPSQLSPHEYSKIVEADGLILTDDIAIILEAKAGAVRSQSRTGDPVPLRQDLKKIITDADDQANRLRERIVMDGGIRLRDGTWLDLSRAREVHAVAVSLDDLSGIATITSALVESGLLTGTVLPWTVSLHDLRIICELVERPAELILYLRRRTEPNVTRRFHAVDELDLFLHMYATGLYVNPDPARIRAELPQLGEPAVGVGRRYRNQSMQFLTTRTGPLDNWYMFEHGYRKTPAPKPTINAEPDVLNLIDLLARRREPGWLSAGVTILEGSTAVRRQYVQNGPAVYGRTLVDGRHHTFAVLGGDRRDNSFVLIWASPSRDESVEAARDKLTEYVTAKKHQLQLARGYGFLYDETGLVATAYDGRIPGPDDALDQVVSRLGLKPVEQHLRARPPEMRSGRKPRSKTRQRGHK